MKTCHGGAGGPAGLCHTDHIRRFLDGRSGGAELEGVGQQKLNENQWFCLALEAVQALTWSLRSTGTQHLPILASWHGDRHKARRPIAQVLHTDQLSGNTLSRLAADPALKLLLAMRSCI